MRCFYEEGQVAVRRAVDHGLYFDLARSGNGRTSAAPALAWRWRSPLNVIGNRGCLAPARAARLARGAGNS